MLAVVLSYGSVLPQGPPSTSSYAEEFSEAPCRRRPTKRRHSDKGSSERKLPSFNYYLDESDPDLVVLRRQDGSFVAAFSSLGVTREGIIEAARVDYRELVRKWEESGGDPA
jgi:hypothetical protein